MNTGFAKEIFGRHPVLFHNTEPFEIYCEDGWADVIDDTLRVIEGWMGRNPKVKEQWLKHGHVLGIKEKYGRLRIGFRFDVPVEDMSDEVASFQRILIKSVPAIERYSTKFCEKCGDRSIGVCVMNGGLLKTLCEKHKEEHGASIEDPIA